MPLPTKAFNPVWYAFIECEAIIPTIGNTEQAESYFYDLCIVWQRMFPPIELVQPGYTGPRSSQCSISEMWASIWYRKKYYSIKAAYITEYV